MPVTQPVVYLNNAQFFKSKWNALFEQTQQLLFSKELATNNNFNLATYLSLMESNIDNFYAQNLPHNKLLYLKAIKKNTAHFYNYHLSLMQQRSQDDLVIWTGIMNLAKFAASWGMAIATTALSFPIFLWVYLRSAAAIMKVVGMLLQTLPAISELISLAGVFSGYQALASMASLVTLGLGLVLTLGIIISCVVNLRLVFKGAFGAGSIAFNSVNYLSDSLSSCLLSLFKDNSLDFLKKEQLELIRELEQELEQFPTPCAPPAAPQPPLLEEEPRQYSSPVTFFCPVSTVNPAYIPAGCESFYAPQ